jgi:type VI secretion system ImpC/EvpB family protein/type VI secretion system ImpB/VipA family protein
MTISFNFGRLVNAAAPANTTVGRTTGPFRIALLGDFSARAHRGELRCGDELARCKPMRLDVDTIDKVIASFQTTLRLPIGTDGASIELRIASLDDLHPDRLYESVPLFAELVQLRQRLAHPKTFMAAADEVRRWCTDTPLAALAPSSALPLTTARGSALRIDAKLSDFARLLNAAPRTRPAPSPVDELLRRVVAPHVVEAAAPDAQALTTAVDRALTAAMCGVLHDPDFQGLEAAWRSLDFVVRRVQTGAALQVALYDISAEEFAADLSATDDLKQTALYRLLIEQPALDAQQGPLSALIANYGFEMTPPHAELLGRVARIAGQARAPFIAAIGRDCIGARDEDLHPLVVESWRALRALPASRYLALTVPRFLLRTPYGERTEPIDSFEFEEWNPQAGLKTLLWGNGAVLAGVLLARHAQKSGAAQAPGGALSEGDMPYFFHTDSDGDTVALPCTERLLSERMAAQLHARGFIPVLALKGRPEVRLGGFLSVAGVALAGPWSAAEALPDEPAPAMTAAPAEPAEPAASAAVASGASDAAAAAEADLDALLAQLSESAQPAAASADAIDPDLAQLLADL